jgi:hypothetical protein
MKCNIIKLCILSLISFTFTTSHQAAILNWDVVSRFNLNPESATEGVRSALRAAREHFRAPENKEDTLTLFFPKGDYQFMGLGNAIDISDVNPSSSGRLIIKGQGMNVTKFIIHNNNVIELSDGLRGIYGKNASHITFADIHISVSHQTVTQGEVAGHGKGYVDITIHSGFPFPDTLQASYNHPSEAGRYLRKYSNNTSNPYLIGFQNEQIPWTAVTQTQDPRTFRFLFLNKTLVPFSYKIGDVIGIKLKHGIDNYRFLDCRDIRWENIRLSRKTRGLFHNCNDISIDNLRIEREVIGGRTACLASPEGGPQFAVTAGGVMMVPVDRYNRGLSITNCRIVGTGDDCFGLFQQISDGRFPTIANCTFIDSFARGIYENKCSGLVYSNNTHTRAPYLSEDRQ